VPLRTGPDGPLPYLLHTPAAPPDAPPPLIVFLHGRGEAGDEKDSLEGVAETGLPMLARDDALPAVAGREFPFVIVAPQARALWRDQRKELSEFLGLVPGRHGADAARVYLTGISMGADACWDLAKRSPARIAALLPVFGGVPLRFGKARRIPTWVFAGAEDGAYRIDRIKSRVDRRAPRGAEIKLTTIPGAGHERKSWDPIYAREDVYTWLLKQPPT